MIATSEEDTVAGDGEEHKFCEYDSFPHFTLTSAYYVLPVSLLSLSLSLPLLPCNPFLIP